MIPSLLVFQILHISVCILRTVMYPFPEAYPGHSRAAKINLFAKIVSVFKLRLLTILVREELWLHLWPVLTQAINCFPIHEYIKQIWRHHICKHQNITSTLVFTCNSFIVFSFITFLLHFILFDWKFVDLSIFCFYKTKRVRKIGGISEVCICPRPVDIIYCSLILFVSFL